MLKNIKTRDFGKVVAVEYRKISQVGGSRMLPLTEYYPKSDQVRIIVIDCDDNSCTLVIEKINE